MNTPMNRGQLNIGVYQLREYARTEQHDGTYSVEITSNEGILLIGR